MSSNLDRAIEIVNTAIAADTKQNYPEAYKQYSNALDYFMLALKYERSERSKQLLRAKVKEYMDRAETLKEWIQQADEKRAKKAIGANVIVDEPNVKESKCVERLEPSKACVQQAQLPRAVQSSTTLDRATEIVYVATEAENKQNYREAYKHYSDALDCFMLAAIEEKDDHAKTLLRQKIKDYIERAETMKHADEID